MFRYIHSVHSIHYDKQTEIQRAIKRNRLKKLAVYDGDL